MVRGHWINHFKQELCWGFRISSVTYFSFLFSTAFPAFPLLFVKENQWNKIKSQKVPGNERCCGPAYRKASGSFSRARRAALVASISPVLDLAAAGAGGSDAQCRAGHRWDLQAEWCSLCSKALDDKSPPDVNIGIHPLVPAAAERRSLLISTNWKCKILNFTPNIVFELPLYEHWSCLGFGGFLC